MKPLPSLLVTGAGGFVGKHLLARLDPAKYQAIYYLTHKRENVRLPESTPGNINVIEGDLLDASTYETYLEQVDTVIHLAALTGKANPKDYFKVNAYGTMLLLDRCKQAGVKNFLFVSSIAVSFKNKYRYFYAQSKEEAENYVKTGGLNYTILRPTMIMGKGSPVFAGLAMLTGLPVIPVFGKGNVRVQPVHVEDAAKAIVQVEADTRYHGEVLEIGGPETIAIKDFMKKIALTRGKKNPRALPLPMGIIVFSLSILERVVYGLLPFTIGQLGSFRNHSTAESNSLSKRLSPFMKGLDEMIANGLEKEAVKEIPKPLMKECRVFCRYLVKQKPDNYILEKYYQCHQRLTFTPVDFHDALLLKIASVRPFFTRTADAYSRFFRSNSLVRKKLAYLFAILEVSPPYFRYVDSADGPGKLGFIIKAGLKGAGLAFHLFFSALFLFPLQLVSRLTGKKTGKTGAVEGNNG
jgi:nucleoside-diphosphate-sugar epimerase